MIFMIVMSSTSNNQLLKTKEECNEIYGLLHKCLTNQLPLHPINFIKSLERTIDCDSFTDFNDIRKKHIDYIEDETNKSDRNLRKTYRKGDMSDRDQESFMDRFLKVGAFAQRSIKINKKLTLDKLEEALNK